MSKLETNRIEDLILIYRKETITDRGYFLCYYKHTIHFEYHPFYIILDNYKDYRQIDFIINQILMVTYKPN